MEKSKLFTLGDHSVFPSLNQLANVSRRGLEVLGTPVGDDDYMNEELPKKFKTANMFCKLVTQLKEPK